MKNNCFCDRIHYLANIFGSDDLAFYLSLDSEDVEKWANSVTLVAPPCHIDYIYFSHKNPEFSIEWLKEGKGDIFISGTEDENRNKIIAREAAKKVQEDIDIMEKGHPDHGSGDL